MNHLTDLPLLHLPADVYLTGRLPRLAADFAMAHGPIFRYEVDFQSAVMMVGPEANRFVMHTGRHHFSHEQGWTPIVGEMAGQGLLNMDDPPHAAHRKMWNPAFTAAYLQTYIPVMHQVIQERVSGWSGRGFINAHQESQEITFDIAAAALGGLTRGPDMDQLREMFWMMLHGFDADTPEEFWTRLTTVRGRVTQMLLGLISERRLMDPEAAATDVLGLIVHARDDDGRPLSDIEILGHLNILLIAGHETTTSLSAWLMHKLATETEWRHKLRAEVDEVLADIPIGDTARSIPVEAIAKMTQLEYFIKEVGRLYPPVFMVPRGTLSDFVFHDTVIPKGTNVRLNLAASHLLPDSFSEPEHFDPLRFAPPRREDRATPYSLVTFGGGPRVCIGLNFAMIEVKVLAAHLLRHYEVEIPADSSPTHGGYWTALPINGLPVSFAPRSGKNTRR
ncbi:MAG: cytochrome P450 [Ardenticatenaceae bacterium]|nr:cytochrome P450 [Ardenticatenaceae bacterium]